MSAASLDAIGFRACASLCERGVRLTAREGFDPEACDELSADAAAALGLRAGDVVCEVCADAARSDAKAVTL